MQNPNNAPVQQKKVQDVKIEQPIQTVDAIYINQ